jgi:hypothetical protein
VGFKIDFIVEGGDLIDDHCNPAIYTQDIKVGGNSCSDTVFLQQDGQVVGFTTRQFEEFIREVMKSSLFCDLRNELREE